MPEAKVKQEIDEFLSSLGADYWGFKPVNFGYGRKGIPDYVGIFLSWGVTVETKRKGGKLRPWQDRECDAVKRAGGVALRNVTSVEQIRPVFAWMRAHRPLIHSGVSIERK